MPSAAAACLGRRPTGASVSGILDLDLATGNRSIGRRS